MNKTITSRSRTRGCLLGLAVGDAIGTTVEFQPRGSFPPLADLVGGGVFGLPAGAWTDDTSMALCLATSLVECQGFDAADQMERYCRWWQEGYLSSTGTCFDIGGTVQAALVSYQFTGEPFAGSTDPMSAGNGCIMRLAPIPMYFHNDPNLTDYAADSSRTTHGAAECLDACRLLAAALAVLLDGGGKELLRHLAPERLGVTSPKVRALARAAYLGKPRERIRGSGYVVDCLEAALWCFARSSSFAECVLTAANLGDDADTTAAVAGQLAGAYYGEEGIPAKWLDQLVMVDDIRALADRLARP